MARPAPVTRPAGVVARAMRVARTALALFAPLAPLAVLGASTVAGQEHPLPFAPGEVLTYQVRVSRLGDVGTGRMWIEGPVGEQGVPTWVFRSEITAGKGPVRATDRSASWFDPRRGGILRFEKRERHILSTSEEQVRIDRAGHRWADADGPSGDLGHDAPLDELSFLYFLRTLPVDRDTVMRFERHFDRARNPTIVRIVGSDTVTTPAGTFFTRVVEMQVRDPKRYKGSGTIRVHLHAGTCHIPVRIESRMPVIGVTTLTLTGWSHSPQYPMALPCEQP